MTPVDRTIVAAEADRVRNAVAASKPKKRTPSRRQSEPEVA
jgi:hypothetical protein